MPCRWKRGHRSRSIEILSWKVQHALIKAKLEPYLGFLHSTAKGKPSLICDFQELYRYLVDDFVIQYCRRLQKKDFTIKNEDFSTKRKGRREYLNDSQTHDFVKVLNQYFKSKVRARRIRSGASQGSIDRKSPKRELRILH